MRSDAPGGDLLALPVLRRLFRRVRRVIIRRLGQVRGEALARLRAWAESQELGRVTHSKYAPGRLEAWFRSAVHLKTGETSAAPEPPPDVVHLGDCLLPGWTSLLLVGGDTTIGPHRDAAAFARDAAMVNLGASEYLWWASQDARTEPSVAELADGDTVLLNVKVLHASRPTPGRMALTFRSPPPLLHLPLFER